LTAQQLPIKLSGRYLLHRRKLENLNSFAAQNRKSGAIR